MRAKAATTVDNQAVGELLEVDAKALEHLGSGLKPVGFLDAQARGTRDARRTRRAGSHNRHDRNKVGDV